MHTDAFRSEFLERGFALRKGVFGGAALEGLEQDFDAIVAQLEASGEPLDARWGGPAMECPEAAGTVVLHTHNVQCYSSRWLQAFLAPGFLDAAEALVGGDVVLHHSKLFLKPPGIGAPFPLHQDWSYFPTERDSMVAAVVHVSAADSASGCLRLVPGSHRLGRRPGTSGQEASAWLDGFAEEDAVPVEAQPGDVLFFHCLTLHASGANRSPRPRKTVLAQLMSGDDAVEPGNAHPDAGLVLRGRNRRMTRSRAGR